MAFCGNCGTQIQDGGKFCPSCGKEVVAAPVQQPQEPVPTYQQQEPQQQPVQQAPKSDAEENKVIAILSYILFFIPLITGDHKKSPFVKFHMNQGTIVFGLSIAFGIVSSILRSIFRVRRDMYYFAVSVTPGWLSAIIWVGNLAILALCILGIYHAATGKTKYLPVIGDKITIFK